MITMYRGDSKSLKFTLVYKGTTTPFPLTGYIARLTVKKFEKDITPIFQVKVDPITNPELGIVVLDMFPVDTEKLTYDKYFFDVEIANANRSKVYTIKKDVINVKIDITQPPFPIPLGD